MSFLSSSNLFLMEFIFRCPKITLFKLLSFKSCKISPGPFKSVVTVDSLKVSLLLSYVSQ